MVCNHEDENEDSLLRYQKRNRDDKYLYKCKGCNKELWLNKVEDYIPIKVSTIKPKFYNEEFNNDNKKKVIIKKVDKKKKVKRNKKKKGYIKIEINIDEIREKSAKLIDNDKHTKYLIDLKPYSELDIFSKSSRILPKYSGVYFLINNNSIVYVGKASKISNRLTTHKKSNWGWNQFAYIECKTSLDRDILEKFYIGKYKPKYNKEPIGLEYGLESIEMLE